MKKRYIALLSLLVIIILVSILKNTRSVAYSEFTVEAVDVSDTLVLAGVIDVENRVELGFAQSGRVESISKQTGDVVKKGDVIARIGQNKLQADLIEAQSNYSVTQVNGDADVESAEAAFEKRLNEQNYIVKNLYQEYLSGDLQAYLETGSSGTITAPVLTGSYLSSEVGEYTFDVYASTSPSGFSYRLSGLESGVGTAEVNQASRLGARGLYIQFDEDTLYNNTSWVIPIPNVRSSTYLSRKKAYENALATRERIISDYQTELNRVTTKSSNALSLIDAQKQQAQARIQAVYSQLSDGKITAPFDGIIAKNDLELGEIVSAYTPLITLVNSLEKELVLNIPEIYINRIELDDEVDIVLDAYKDTVFTGRISYIDIIDTLVDGVPVYQTTVKLETEDERIRIGMNARASIVTEAKSQVLAVPAHFVMNDESGSYVYVANLEEKRSVETGLKGSNGMIEITSGLAAGETIVIEKE